MPIAAAAVSESRTLAQARPVQPLELHAGDGQVVRALVAEAEPADREGLDVAAGEPAGPLVQVDQQVPDDEHQAEGGQPQVDAAQPAGHG
jgi:hypothetical protein